MVISESVCHIYLDPLLIGRLFFLNDYNDVK